VKANANWQKNKSNGRQSSINKKEKHYEKDNLEQSDRPLYQSRASHPHLGLARATPTIAFAKHGKISVGLRAGSSHAFAKPSGLKGCWWWWIRR